MQRKGIGTLYHVAVARAALELGVENVVVDAVMSLAMHALCTSCGMTQTQDLSLYFYRVEPASLMANAQRRAEAKGWR